MWIPCAALQWKPAPDYRLWRRVLVAPAVWRRAWPRPAIAHQLVGSEPPPPWLNCFCPDSRWVSHPLYFFFSLFSVLRCIGGTAASVPGRRPLGAQPLFAQKILLLLRGLANRWLMKGEPWTIAADEINDGDGHATMYMRMVSWSQVNQYDEHKMHTSQQIWGDQWQKLCVEH